MTDNSNYGMPPGPPPDGDGRERDIFDEIDDDLAQVTEDDIEARLSETLRRAGHGTCLAPPAGPDLAAVLDGQGLARQMLRIDMQSLRPRWVAMEERLRLARAEAERATAAAQAEAARAREEADRALSMAAEIVRAAREQAEAIIRGASDAKARAITRELYARRHAEAIVADACRQAEAIVADARREACDLGAASLASPAGTAAQDPGTEHETLAHMLRRAMDLAIRAEAAPAAYQPRVEAAARRMMSTAMMRNPSLLVLGRLYLDAQQADLLLPAAHARQELPAAIRERREEQGVAGAPLVPAPMSKTIEWLHGHLEQPRCNGLERAGDAEEDEIGTGRRR
jgi:hypothetical protein